MIPIVNVEMSEQTYSVGMIDVVARFVASRGGISEEEAARWAEDVRSQAARGEYFLLDEVDLDPHAEPPRDVRARSARKR